MSDLVLWDHDRAWVPWVIVAIAAAVAAGTDLNDRRIPNLLTFPLLVAGLAWSVTVGGWSGLGESLAACVFVGIPFVILFLFAGGGAGDAKMMGAIGAWVGLTGGVLVLLCVAVAGILLAVCHAIAARRVRTVLANLTGIATGVVFVLLRHGRLEQVPRVQPSAAMQTIPYGVAIFIGTAAAAGGALLW